MEAEVLEFNTKYNTLALKSFYGLINSLLLTTFVCVFLNDYSLLHLLSCIFFQMVVRTFSLRMSTKIVVFILFLLQFSGLIRHLLIPATPGMYLDFIGSDPIPSFQLMTTDVLILFIQIVYVLSLPEELVPNRNISLDTSNVLGSLSGLVPDDTRANQPGTTTDTDATTGTGTATGSEGQNQPNTDNSLTDQTPNTTANARNNDHGTHSTRSVTRLSQLFNVPSRISRTGSSSLSRSASRSAILSFLSSSSNSNNNNSNNNSSDNSSDNNNGNTSSHGNIIDNYSDDDDDSGNSIPLTTLNQQQAIPKIREPSSPARFEVDVVYPQIPSSSRTIHNHTISNTFFGQAPLQRDGNDAANASNSNSESHKPTEQISAPGFESRAGTRTGARTEEGEVELPSGASLPTDHSLDDSSFAELHIPTTELPARTDVLQGDSIHSISWRQMWSRLRN